MINLYTTYFVHKNHTRQAEIEYVLQKNIENPVIGRIYLLAEAPLQNLHEKIVVVPIDKRPTFKQYFSKVNEVTGDDDMNVIANSDIFFDGEGLLKLRHWMCKEDAVALTRWNVSETGEVTFSGDGCCQDTWVFCGAIKRPINCDFPMGYRGCDNKLAYEIRQSGYSLYNPSKMCPTYHYHNSGVRDWSWTNELFVPGPYNCVEIMDQQ